MKQIWNKIKSILFNLFGRFRYKHPAVKPIVKEAKPITEEKRVVIQHFGPNMPKRQPCPNGHGWKKRVNKTMGGAYYHCQFCGDFFIRAARI